MDPKAHWESIFSTKNATEVSWYQPSPRTSLQIIQAVAPQRTATVLDVGGGASTLVDGLLAAGYQHLTILDLSQAALEQARARLGPDARRVRWQEANILTATLDEGVDVWHDRAVFHFLTDPADRRRYVEQVRRSLRQGGHGVIATFAEDGPERCSGLKVARYSPDALHRAFGDGFELLESRREEHATPSGATQRFVYCLLRHCANA
jgi:SAM-dependent methyltransferase